MPSPEPNLQDPFAPDPQSERTVICIHCNQTYQEKEIKWDARSEFWVCRNWPACGGAGLGFDIFPAEELLRDSEHPSVKARGRMHTPTWHGVHR